MVGDMNVFLLHPDPTVSAQILKDRDPVRGRKQLVECCQLLAAAEARVRPTTMFRADGLAYGISHPHHPCTVYTWQSLVQRRLVYEVGLALAQVFPTHASSTSITRWQWFDEAPTPPEYAYVVVRKGYPHHYTNCREVYSQYIRPYWEQKLGVPA